MFEKFRELGNRAKNMVFTVADDYDIKVSKTDSASHTDTKSVKISSPEVLLKWGISEDAVENHIIYASAHEASHVKHSNLKLLHKALQKANAEGMNPEFMGNLINIIEDYYVDMQVAKERPGFVDMRNGVAKGMVESLTKKSDDHALNLLTAVACKAYDVDITDALEVDREMVDMAMDVIHSAKDFTSTQQSIDAAFDLYRKWFPKRPSPKFDSSEEGTGEPSDEKRESKDKSKSKDSKPSKGKGGDKEETDDMDSPEPGDGEEGESDGDDNEEGDNENEEGNDEEDSDGADSDDDGESGDNSEDGEGGDDSEEGDDGDGDGDNDGEAGEGDSTEAGDTPSGEDNPDASASFKEPSSTKLSEDELKDLYNDLLGKDMVDTLASKDAKEELKKEMGKALSEMSEMDGMERALEVDYRNAKGSFGLPIISDTERKLLEREYCKGAHVCRKVLWTRGVDKNHDESYYYKGNKAYYVKYEASNKQNIARLSGTIRDAMRASYDPHGYMSDNGSVSGSDVWKAVTCDRTDVFYKEDYSEEGGFVVDILLDASGSQSGRQGLISTQAFILAESLTNAGIPVRVSGFSSSGHTCGMILYRDYDAPAKDNDNVFEYHAFSENRDGLALLLCSDQLKKRKEAHKILIMLQDGCPGDGYTSEYTDRLGAPGTYYGKPGNDDTAQVVRKLRRDGIALMGIYTGSGGDLDTESFIFGNDFAFIRDTKDFARIAGNYIVKQIKDLVE